MKLCNCEKKTSHKYIRTFTLEGVTKVYNYMGCSKCGMPIEKGIKTYKEVPCDKIVHRREEPSSYDTSAFEITNRREREFLGLDPLRDCGDKDY